MNATRAATPGTAWEPLWPDDDETEPGNPPAEQAGGWRNPPFAVRVTLVGAVWLVPGTLLGALAAAVLVAPDPLEWLTVGAVSAAVCGAFLEGVGG
jgi:hypothetical protein